MAEFGATIGHVAYLFRYRPPLHPRRAAPRSFK